MTSPSASSLNIRVANATTEAITKSDIPVSSSSAAFFLQAPPQCDDAGFMTLVSATKDIDKITHLHLGGDTETGFGCNVTDSILELIAAAFPNLKTLELQMGGKITDVGLHHVSTLKGITSLNVAWCGAVTDAGLHEISKLANITSLNLAGCERITDVGLHHLSSLSNLSFLELCYCKLITDVGLVHVSQLSRIASLNLFECIKITDSGLAHIANHLRNLTSLDLLRCNKITEDAKAKFKTALPNCHIYC